MTDNEIKNGLTELAEFCGKCGNLTKENDILKNALDLINRLQAENDEKQKTIDNLHEVNEQLYEEMSERQKEEVRIAKKYAIIGFAERLIDKARTVGVDEMYDGQPMYVSVECINKVKKEMIGE